jgi:N-acetylglutamate synthase-like GNAT family acetyltransferase
MHKSTDNLPNVKTNAFKLAVFHPETEGHREERDALLQISLRPEPLPFPIASEYPLVLTEKGNKYSYCAAKTDDPKKKIIAHANLWPRQLNTSPMHVIGLVGNVATNVDYRGQGVMSELLRSIAEQGRRLGLSYLVLWSDLGEFYQKLGFSSLGKEKRWLLEAEKLEATFDGNALTKDAFRLVSPSELSSADLRAMLRSQPPLPLTLERSATDLAYQLTIPEMEIFVKRSESSQIDAYFVIGKGYDMVGVIHDWGAVNAQILIHGVFDCFKQKKWRQLLLLAPAALSPSWDNVFFNYATSCSTHDMALALNLNPHQTLEPKLLKQGFIWGLDSI